MLSTIAERMRLALRWVLDAEAIGEETVPGAPNGGESHATRSPGAGTDVRSNDGENTNAHPGAPSRKGGSTKKSAVPHPRLRFWVAIGLVVAAVSTAAGAWRAEIFTEYATQKDALARQSLTGLQLSERSDEEMTMSQIRQLGAYQQNSSLSYQLDRQAKRGRGAAANTVGAEAQNEALLAAASTQGFDFVFPTVDKGVATLKPGQVYSSALTYDPTLATFEPGDLEAKASKARTDAVDMAGVTVFFALTVVLLTLSEMMLRRRKRDLDERWSIGHTLAASSLVVWAGAFVLFVVLYVDVPSLR
jgi:hypothetical protein